MTDILKTIDELAGKATPTPWVVCNIVNAPTASSRDIGTPSKQFENAIEYLIASRGHAADMELIVTLANNWPEISARLKAAEILLGALAVQNCHKHDKSKCRDQCPTCKARMHLFGANLSVVQQEGWRALKEKG